MYYEDEVYDADIYDEDDLYHHGILGMKWGVRRYQNEDGSLTPEGERRYKENDYNERAKRTLEYQNTFTGAVVGGPIGGILGNRVSDAKLNNLKNMSDEDAKQYVEQAKKYSRIGRQISGTVLGAGLGGSSGAIIGGVTIAALTGNPALASAAYTGGMTVGGILGGIGGYKIGGKSFNKNFEKGMERNRFTKRSKKEIEEWDKTHSIAQLVYEEDDNE